MVNYMKSSALIALSSVLLSSTFLAFLFLTSFNASAADSVIDNVSLSVQVSCNISSTLNSAHTDRVSNGTYKEDIGITTLKVTCNDNDGFAIYAAGYTGDEIGGTNSTKLVSSNTDTISTGLSLTGNDSQWAMKLETDSNATYPVTLDSDTNGSFGSYHVIPSTYTKVAHRDGLTDIGINAVGAVLTTTYRAYAAPEQPSGTYNGKVIYTVVHPANEIPLQEETTDAGKICYYPNGGMVLGSMGCQTIPSSGTTNDVSPTSAILLASNFSRDGYGFAGWSTTYDYSDSEGFYGPQEYIEFESGAYSGNNSGLSLYAHWVKSTGSLQDWTGCSSLPEGFVTALTDERDDETYAAAKLEDGNCWMIENLRLENTATTGATNIALAQGYETGFTGLANPEGPALFANVTTANSLYSIDGSTTNTIPGSSDQGYRFPRYNNVNTPANPTNVSDRPINPTTNDATNSTSDAGMYSYGNYYTWTAANANTTATSDGDYNTKSICPKGWSLPRGGSKPREATNDFWNLIVTHLNNGTNPANYDSFTSPYYTGSAEAVPVANVLRAYPNNFVYSGFINGSVYNRGSVGYYWSSTTNGSNYGYYLNLRSTIIYPGTLGNYKYEGRSVRCIVPGV